MPASLFSNLTWNGVPAGPVSVSCSNLMPLALIVTTLALPDPLGSADADPDPLGAGAFDGAGAYVQPASAEVHAPTRTAESRAADTMRAARIGRGTSHARDTGFARANRNLPRRRSSCRPVGAERSEAVRVGRWYWWVRVLVPMGWLFGSRPLA